MRVIAGSAKGKNLVSSEGLATRPTLDRVKEAVFGSLQFDIAGTRWLDLFAGSGGIGIEALSRGARECVFADIDPKSVGIIKKNLSSCGLTDRATVMTCGYESALTELAGVFDYIYMDPPYASGFYESAVRTVLERGLIAKDGYILAEHDGSLALTGIKEEKRRKYGKAFVSWLCEEDR